MNMNSRQLILALAAIGLAVAVVFIGITQLPRSADVGADSVPVAATADYGEKLLRDTAKYLGPDHDVPARRFSGSNLACASCHIDIGTRPGTLSLLQAASKYPRPSGRDGRTGDLRDRINGCMQRSMNGRPLPRDSVEMIAMESYILGLGNQYRAMGESQRTANEPVAFVEPDRAADIDAGKQVFIERCQICHGADGRGLRASANHADGYVFPPLWGPDSFNNGAGMTRLLTAARFVKARMPFGQPDLTDDQAYDVSAYFNSNPRPVKNSLEVDYPDLTTKPVDSPYPPYADPFPVEQHRLGPFQPIREYYKDLKKESSSADDA